MQLLAQLAITGNRQRPLRMLFAEICPDIQQQIEPFLVIKPPDRQRLAAALTPLKAFVHHRIGDLLAADMPAAEDLLIFIYGPY
ncbi:phospho-2-dehydro-3-deoxyheptonate aldolase AroH [Corchorus olitorius]|uniref:Phospho-2-dehydro-3-deoxyheptonate aldolase AroH n=1 Tax=Corchorus olitorius TaxID=93759 RepID=A0A1R3L223_9ROSI|nr:phospho-2-dehydro-3-deoxyheptonate aldolase AroH [Corchorus olitorius]